jgi:hypothetical protein
MWINTPEGFMEMTALRIRQVRNLDFFCLKVLPLSLNRKKRMSNVLSLKNPELWTSILQRH